MCLRKLYYLLSTIYTTIICPHLKYEGRFAVHPFRALMPINNLAWTAFSLPTGSSVHFVSLNISVHKQTSMHMCTCIVKTNGRMYRSRCVKFILALSAFLSGNTAAATKWTLTCERINERSQLFARDSLRFSLHQLTHFGSRERGF